jgi:hypothetical protein
MTIANIKNSVIRRTVLIAFGLPILLLECCIGVCIAVAEVLEDFPSAFLSAWKGRR